MIRELLYKCLLKLSLNSKWVSSQQSCIRTAELSAETRWVLLQAAHHQSPEHVSKHFTSVHIRLNVNRCEAGETDGCVWDQVSFFVLPHAAFDWCMEIIASRLTHLPRNFRLKHSIALKKKRILPRRFNFTNSLKPEIKNLEIHTNLTVPDRCWNSLDCHIRIKQNLSQSKGNGFWS